MGFFDLFRSKKREAKPIQTEDNGNIILSMPMFKERGYSLEKVLNDLKSHWGLSISEVSGDDEVATLTINGSTVAIAKIPAPIPKEELEPIFSYSYLWNNVEKEVLEHNAHAIVSILDKEKSKVEKFTLLTMVNASILRTAENAIGIYHGSQTLLLPKDLYTDFSNFLLEENLPIILWVYIGIISNQERNSLYTFGMKEFGKQEIEIINSSISRSELHDFISLVINYILSNDVNLKDGETIGLTAEQKIKITESKAVYLDGKTLKLEL